MEDLDNLEEIEELAGVDPSEEVKEEGPAENPEIPMDEHMANILKIQQQLEADNKKKKKSVMDTSESVPSGMFDKPKKRKKDDIIPEVMEIEKQTREEYKQEGYDKQRYGQLKGVTVKNLEKYLEAIKENPNNVIIGLRKDNMHKYDLFAEKEMVIMDAVKPVDEPVEKPKPKPAEQPKPAEETVEVDTAEIEPQELTDIDQYSIECLRNYNVLFAFTGETILKSYVPKYGPLFDGATKDMEEQSHNLMPSYTKIYMDYKETTSMQALTNPFVQIGFATGNVFFNRFQKNVELQKKGFLGAVKSVSS